MLSRSLHQVWLHIPLNMQKLRDAFSVPLLGKDKCLNVTVVMNIYVLGRLAHQLFQAHSRIRHWTYVGN